MKCAFRLLLFVCVCRDLELLDFYPEFIRSKSLFLSKACTDKISR